MFFKSKIFRLSLILSLTLSVTFAVFADTIRLKDGSIIKGKIVGFGSGRFTVLIADGTRRRQMNFNAAEVESISFDAETGNDSSGKPTNYGGNVSSVSSATTPIARTTPTPAPAESAAPTVIQPASSPAAANIKPITINVSVLADSTSNGWTNSGFVVRKGQKIRVGSSGRISLGGGRYTTSEGIATLPDGSKLMAKEATGGLIAVIGDDNNEFIFIGAGREFTAARDGALFLGVNEGNLEDNSGLFNVKVDIYPN